MHIAGYCVVPLAVLVLVYAGIRYRNKLTWLDAAAMLLGALGTALWGVYIAAGFLAAFALWVLAILHSRRDRS